MKSTVIAADWLSSASSREQHNSSVCHSGRCLWSVICLRTLSRSSGSAITSGVSPTRLRRGSTGTPALLRRAIAMRERPRAVGIEAKSCSEFKTWEAPLPSLALGTSKTATLAPTSKYLAQSNKSLRRRQARRREAIPAARRNFVPWPTWPTAQRDPVTRCHRQDAEAQQHD
jgi:hypothetical protein